MEPEFVELVLREADRILGVTEGAILTLKEGILCANAGVDRSNAPPGHATLMPSNPNLAAEELRASLRRLTKANVGVVVDSSVKPLRLRTVGQAMGVAGFEPVIDCRRELDLYGRPLRITFRALADQLATASQLAMGEAAERIPVVVLRGTGIELSGKPKSSPKIAPERCIYLSTIKRQDFKSNFRTYC